MLRFQQLPPLSQVQSTDLPYSATSCNASEDFKKAPRLMKVRLSKLPCIKCECDIENKRPLHEMECQGAQNCFRSHSGNSHIYKCFY